MIYNNQRFRYEHIKSILQGLNFYLENIEFINNVQNISLEGNNNIGKIIKYDFNNNIKENNSIINKNNLNLEESSPNNVKKFNGNKIPVINNIKNNNIINNFNNCPLIGLANIGATCYMNATLQCFCHIEQFINFFKYNPQINSTYKNNTDNLSYSFKLLIENLWPDKYIPSSKNNYYSPNEFKDKISKMNPLFEGVAANDAKDLVNFIIMTLHLELNKVKKQGIINNNSEIIDQTSKNSIFKSFIKNFMMNNQSIISDLFYSMNCNITKCGNCHTQLYNYQIYFFIIFPLEEVRKFNSSNNFSRFNFNNMNMNLNEVNLYDCFNYDCKTNIMDGQNLIYCNNCKMNSIGYMKTHLVTGPEILIILLNRGQGREFDVKILFYEDLNLYHYIELKQTGYNYKLIEVITHIGESNMSGHFIAYCRDFISNKWHKYNDAIVSEVNNFENDVINFAMPYLLFYQKVK